MNTTLARPNYDKCPYIPINGCVGLCQEGWEDIISRLFENLAKKTGGNILAIECYTGVFEEEIALALTRHLPTATIVRSAAAFLPAEQIEALTAPFCGGDDPIFGRMGGLQLYQYFDPAKVASARRLIDNNDGEPVVILGTGASLIHSGDILVYADLARWEAQMRMRRDEISNLGADNRDLKWSLQYKRAYFLDWRVCDRLKRTLMGRCDFVLDTCKPGQPKMLAREAAETAYRQALARPFRVVPFFDPAPWGGQWMKEHCELPEDQPNYGWCFDCVPEENSIVFRFDDAFVELPSINLVFHDPVALLGMRVHARFGAEFPIRFDFLDTIGGGNLSFQVHPLTAYARDHFGIGYTQDESYYILHSEGDANVYLGLKDGVDPNEMMRCLQAAQNGGGPFDDATYVCKWPARKHDHFLIPAGTCHCSGSGTMVLEISATPYIFTFKMWDWGRNGMDGLPRPINIDRAMENIIWGRTEKWVERELVNAIQNVSEGDGWKEERTGLHAQQFIETRRHWFTGPVFHDTAGGVNVINLVEGREAIVESPSGAFEPFVVHYAETFIVPACIGAYTIRPHGESVGSTCGTLKAYVRD